jgi:hypothetical protein
MPNHVVAALYFEDLAKQEHRPEERERLLVLARSFRWLAIAEAKRYTEDMRKRPPAPSVKRLAPTRKRGLATDEGVR